MKTRLALRNLLEPVYRDSPDLRAGIKDISAGMGRMKNKVIELFPQLIKPEPRTIYLTLTANCNLRCKGCKYGRDFMPGQQLPLEIVRQTIDDAKELDFEFVRLYGGEPLLHKDIVQIAEHCARVGIRFYLTTNGMLLKKKIDALFDAGLRRLTIGFYGLGADYDAYVQRKDRFRELEENLAYTRERYGERIKMELNWLLMKPTCDLDNVRQTWAFAERYQAPIFVNLIHYSLPYFTEGDDRELQFTAQDRPAIERVVAELLALRERQPHLLPTSPIALRSIPDWLVKGPNMRVPCNRRRLIWVGADGTVQMCYVTFKLGNLHQTRLKDMLFTKAHDDAARAAFKLDCPNCHCGWDSRTLEHGATRRLYTHA